MRRLIALTAALVVASAASASPAPAFTLRDLSNQPVALSDFEGRVVVVDFWATWCGPCKQELPHMQQLLTDLGDQGLTVLAVATDDVRDKPKVKPYVRRSGFTFPVLYDTQSEVLGAYNPNRTLPFLTVVDRQGEIAVTYSGYVPGDEAMVRAAVTALLAGAPLPPDALPPEAPAP